MNKNQNKRGRSLFEGGNSHSYLTLWKKIFAVKNIHVFDFFQQSSSTRDKLQIIYANIRV